MEAAKTNEQIWTIGRLLAWTAEHLAGKEVEDARLSAELLLAHAMGCRRINLYARFNEEPTGEQRAVFRELVKGAGEHRPIAYLIGHREFYSIDFVVSPAVLIPRPETEVLVERALHRFRERPGERYEVWDVGTGSGCIAVAIAKRQAAARVLGTDISEAALVVAGENARRAGVAERVRLLCADLFAVPVEAIAEGGFDLIVSNPPYVAEADRESLPRNVRDHEPATALFSGPRGLDVYARMARDVGKFIRPDGALLVEVGFGQADAVERMLVEDGGMAADGRHKDMAGIERVLEFTMQA